jgi:hypothetical protein
MNIRRSGNEKSLAIGGCTKMLLKADYGTTPIDSSGRTAEVMQCSLQQLRSAKACEEIEQLLPAKQIEKGGIENSEWLDHAWGGEQTVWFGRHDEEEPSFKKVVTEPQNLNIYGQRMSVAQQKGSEYLYEDFRLRESDLQKLRIRSDSQPRWH